MSEITDFHAGDARLCISGFEHCDGCVETRFISVIAIPAITMVVTVALCIAATRLINFQAIAANRALLLRASVIG